MLENNFFYNDDRNTPIYSSIPPVSGEGKNETPSRRGKKKKAQTQILALALVACVAASGFFGFAGGYLSGQINPGQSAAALSTDGQTEVLYQSVVRNVSTGGGSADSPMTVAQVAAAVKESVVEITTETVTTNGRMGQLISQGAGSGVIFSEDGYIVTNNHVVADANSIMVRLSDGTEYTAELVGTDAKSDLAVLKIGASGLTPAVLGESSTLAVGETMVAVGNPLGELGGTVTSGILSALDREITIDGESMRLLQTDTAINPGNSGGGLYNLYGELIGIVNAKSSGTDVEGLGFAIPIDSAKTVMEDIIKVGYVQGRVDAGLTLIDISSAQTAMMYRVNQTGLYVYESTDSGLRSGDRITAVDGKEITGLENYNAAIEAHSVGDTVQITVSRNGQSLTVEITLQELKN